jgi:hypothetical protein
MIRVPIYMGQQKGRYDRRRVFGISGKEVNCFTVVGTMTPKQAEEQADEWLADVLQEEKLRHADIF